MTKNDCIRAAMEQCQAGSFSAAYTYLADALNAPDETRKNDRMDIAKAAMQGLSSNGELLSGCKHLTEAELIGNIATTAVSHADALLAELEKTEVAG